MDANLNDLFQTSGVLRKESPSRSWKVGRVLYLLFVPIVTIVAYLLPYLPYQLPMCLFKLITGYPCAGCGMTRAFEAAAHGHFREAFEWHPVGLALFVAMWFGVIFVAYELVTNKPLNWEGFLRRWGFLLAWSLFFILLAFWLLRLSYYKFGQWFPLPLKFPL
ncbi:MAG: DUF2752 domain-containing protein [Armatimonadetes bacterium]|nr:DUF2752 domain-containing protein [Armatimonadota bacterium]